MPYPDPSSRADWRSVGMERGGDADVLVAAGRGLGGLYLYGYEAECYAKGVIAGDAGRKPPQVHTLMDLILRCGVRRETLTEEMRAFAETRDVSLRYQSGWPSPLSESSIAPAINVCRFLYKLVSREERKARGRKRLSDNLKDREFPT